jgi:tetratricopeptide (TPR) repeat protein
LGDYKGALEKLNLALEKEKELGDEKEVCSIEKNLGELYCGMKEYDESEKHYRAALELAEKINSLKLKKDICLGMHTLYAVQGKFELSLAAYKKYIPLKDSLFGISNQKAILQKQMQFDFEKKEALTKAEFIKQRSEKQLEIERRKQAIAQLEKDKALRELALSQSDLKLKEEQGKSESQKKEVEILKKDKLLKEAEAQEKLRELGQQKLLRNIFISGAGLLLILSFVIFRSLAKSRKDNRIIQSQKKEVESQKMLVEEKQKEILDSIRYAKRIQNSLLPTSRYIERKLRELD